MSNTLVAVIKNGKIELLEPIVIPEGTKLLVTLLPQETSSENKQNWTNFSLQGLEKAYGEDEPEYSLDLLKEINSEYERK